MYFLLFFIIFAFSVFQGNCYPDLVSPMLIVSYLGFTVYSVSYMNTQKKLPYEKSLVNYVYILLAFFTLAGFYLHFKGNFPVTSVNGLENGWEITFYLLLVVISLSLACLLKDMKGADKFALPLAAMILFLFNLGGIYLMGPPNIDVYHFFKEGGECLANLQNPYTHDYPQICTGAAIKLYYYDDPIFLTKVPFQPYPPIAVFFAFLGNLLGDFRIIYAVTFLITPFLAKGILNKLHPDMDSRSKNILALISMFFPSMMYVIHMSWGDTLLPLFLMSFIYFYLNDKKLPAFICLGILLSLKQYTVIFAFIFLFMGINKYKKYFLWVLAIILGPMAIYAAWDLKGFVDGILILHMKQPFRPDGNNLAIYVKQLFGIHLYHPIPYSIILVSATALSLYFSFKKQLYAMDKVDQLRFILNVMMFQYFTFLMFAKAAFINYYTFLFNIIFLVYIFSIDTRPNERKHLKKTITYGEH